MHDCPFCHEMINSSDDFMPHVIKHYSDNLNEMMRLMNTVNSQGDYFDRFVGQLAQKVAAEIIPSIQLNSATPCSAAPKAPRFSFEAVQLTNIAVSTGKTVDEVLSICNEFEQKLFS